MEMSSPGAISSSSMDYVAPSLPPPVTVYEASVMGLSVVNG